MNLLIIFATYAIIFFVLILVHEFGHFLAGWAGGIPARDMKIQMFVFPQRVLLRHEDRWLSPLADWELYRATVWNHLPSIPRVYLFVAGGLLMETLFTSLATIAFVQAGLPKFGWLVAFSTLWLNGTYFAMDVPMAWWHGNAWGDFSGLWTLAKFPTVILVVGIFGVRVLLYWYAVR